MTDPCPLDGKPLIVETACQVSDHSCMIYYVCSKSKCGYGRIDEEENDHDAEGGVTNDR